jgi:hypothetical protein
MYEYGPREIANLKGNYDLDNVEYRKQMAIEDLAKITDEIAVFLRELEAQKARIEQTTFTTYVLLMKSTRSTPVKYKGYLLGVPNIPAIKEDRGEMKLDYFLYRAVQGYGPKIKIDGFGVFVHPVFKKGSEGGWMGKEFSGQDRHAALKYAQELAAEHKAELVKFGC